MTVESDAVALAASNRRSMLPYQIVMMATMGSSKMMKKSLTHLVI